MRFSYSFCSRTAKCWKKRKVYITLLPRKKAARAFMFAICFFSSTGINQINTNTKTKKSSSEILEQSLPHEHTNFFPCKPLKKNDSITVQFGTNLIVRTLTDNAVRNTVMTTINAHPSGCDNIDSNNSDATAPAMCARPGRVTVHC